MIEPTPTMQNADKAYNGHLQQILHCRRCGASTVYKVPDDGDTKPRAICTQCETVHYQNPLNVVGTIPLWQGQVLLCRRNIEPRKGLWTLPAGFMELGETVAQGAARETQEEAGAQFDIGPLFSVVNVPRVGQVHLYHLAYLTSDRFEPGLETIEARLFNRHNIPWDDLAFTTVALTLKAWLSVCSDSGTLTSAEVHVMTVD